LLKLAAGAAEADAGEVTQGASVKLGYFAQHSMEVLNAGETVWQTLENAFPSANVGSLRTLAACFGFPGDDVEKRCRLLSGGEKVRLVMARMLYDPPNFLVLDEPTNHLDLTTKEMLIRSLADYEGTLLLVSHDRHFLSKLTNRVLELDASGPQVYPGGYSEYVVSSGHEAPGMRAL
jgi:ATPase subunit of ABC transporter with duplicated ATPase domains